MDPHRVYRICVFFFLLARARARALCVRTTISVSAPATRALTRFSLSCARAVVAGQFHQPEGSGLRDRRSAITQHGDCDGQHSYHSVSRARESTVVRCASVTMTQRSAMALTTTPGRRRRRRPPRQGCKRIRSGEEGLGGPDRHHCACYTGGLLRSVQLDDHVLPVLGAHPRVGEEPSSGGIVCGSLGDRPDRCARQGIVVLHRFLAGLGTLLLHAASQVPCC